MTATSSSSVVAVSVEPNDASTTLFLGHLARLMPAHVEVVKYGAGDLADKIGGASAIVLVRGLFEFSGVLHAARLLRIPLYYFLDDNFMMLREQAGPWTPFVQQYSVANVGRRLQAFGGVLLSSEALVDYFTKERLHPSLDLFPPIEWQERLSKPAPAHPDELSIAFFGGRHLHDMFSTSIMPAVRSLASERPIRLIAVGMHDRIAPSAGLTVIEQPYDPSYASGLRRLAASGVDVLVHPSPGDLQNGAYKIPHALLSAHALGAVPLVSDRAPYNDLRDTGVAMLCDDTPESWRAALAHVSLVSQRAPIVKRLGEHCASRFGGQVNQAVVSRMLAAHRAPAASARPLRAIVARASILAGRVSAKLMGPKS